MMNNNGGKFLSPFVFDTSASCHRLAAVIRKSRRALFIVPRANTTKPSEFTAMFTLKARALIQLLLREHAAQEKLFNNTTCDPANSLILLLSF
jgi:hypothetical protein